MWDRTFFPRLRIIRAINPFCPVSRCNDRSFLQFATLRTFPFSTYTNKWHQTLVVHKRRYTQFTQNSRMVCTVFTLHMATYDVLHDPESRCVSSNYKRSSHEPLYGHTILRLLLIPLLIQYLDELQHKIPINLAVQTCVANHSLSLKFRSGISHVAEWDAEIQLWYRSGRTNKCWFSSTSRCTLLVLLIFRRVQFLFAGLLACVLCLFNVLVSACHRGVRLQHS